MLHSKTNLCRSLPAWGVSILKILIAGCLAVAFVLPQGVVSAAAPSTKITSVTSDTSVTLQTYNFPANKSFTVRMGEMGTRGVKGTVVAVTDSGPGGSFSATYKIPASLKGRAQISIRMESAEGYYAYDWFTNVSGGSGNTTGSWTAWASQPSDIPVSSSSSTSSSSASVSYGTPYTEINSVSKDSSVTLTAYKFPSNQTFTVRMGAFGSSGINGTVVGTLNSGNGGSFQLTYNIPDNLKGSSKISIRLESPQGFFAYDWFNNQ